MFATIVLPDFYLQAVTRHDPALSQQPLAALDAAATKAVLLQVNEIAANTGVHAGMTPSQALARCLQLVIKARARDREQQVQAILIHHAFMLSPFVENTAPGICTVRFTQTDRLTGKAQRVIDQLAQCHLTARAGIAPNADSSLLAAHLADPILAISSVSDFLAELPIEVLALDSNSIQDRLSPDKNRINQTASRPAQ